MNGRRTGAKLKRDVRNITILERRVQELLRTTDNQDTSRHICQLYPFRDQNIPQAILSGRWDSWLDPFLLSLHRNPSAEQEILQLSREEKAQKLLRLLDPFPDRHRTIWTWNHPSRSKEPKDIAEAIHKVISAAFFQITLREWLVYLDGNKVAAVNRLLLAFRSISTYIKELEQLDPKKHQMVEKVSL